MVFGGVVPLFQIAASEESPITPGRLHSIETELGMRQLDIQDIFRSRTITANSLAAAMASGEVADQSCLRKNQRRVDFLTDLPEEATGATTGHPERKRVGFVENLYPNLIR